MTIAASQLSPHEMGHLEALASDVRSFPSRNARGIAAYKSRGEDCSEFCAHFNNYAAKHPNFAHEASVNAARVLHNVADLEAAEKTHLVTAIVNAMSYTVSVPLLEETDKEERLASCARVFNFIYDKHRDLVPEMKEALGALCAERQISDPLATFKAIRGFGSEGVKLKHPSF